MQHPAVGTAAPAFALRSHHGETIAPMASGRASLLVFFPFAFSGICTSELSGLSDQSSIFDSADVDVLGISCDPVYGLRAMADRDGLAVTLLSDFWPHGEVTRSYGCFDETLGAGLRSSYLVDPGGTVVWTVHHGIGEQRGIDVHVDALRALR